MRNAGIDVDSRLADIGIKVDSLDPSSTIHDSLEWDIQQIISENVDPEKGLFIDNITHWQVMVLYSCYL